MKKTIYLIILTALFSFSCSNDDGCQLQRENDELSVDCTEQSLAQLILCDGNWTSDCGEADWIKISPESGSGDGKSYTSFNLDISYNSGAERTGTVYIVYEGASYPVKVTQAKCNFAYSAPTVIGSLAMNMVSEAKLSIPYSGASGYESVSVSAKITGPSDGLTVTDVPYSDFSKGSGIMEIPISGTPSKYGTVNFEVIVDGSSIGSCSTKIIKDQSTNPYGLPVGWNFYEVDGLESVPGSQYDFSWTTSALNPSSNASPYGNHKVLPSTGNAGAFLTANSLSGGVSSVSYYAFNPSIQIKGLHKDDSFEAVIPVKNIEPEDTLTVEAAFGAAGSGPGCYIIEYSDDNSNWFTAAGARDTTIQKAVSGQYHYYVPAENTSGSRKTYDKATDKGYRKYTFQLHGIHVIKDGNLYIRLRVSIDARANTSETTYAITGTAWGDLKGLEIGYSEQEIQ